MEVFLKNQKINWLQPNQTSRTVNPYRYVFFPTAEGYVPLSEKIDIKGYAQRMMIINQTSKIEVKPVGSMLNDVYMIEAGENEVLAKRFKDWSGFKWFPITLWSFGARSFAVSGQARLAKECAISERLLNEGFNIPKILYISNSERIVFMEFIEGENLSQAIKRYSSVDERRELLEIIEKVGEIIAQVHSSDISLGAAKSDNVLVKANGMIYLVDFEQAQHGGDKAWDIAVFLYYCGHYLQAIDGTLKAASIAIAFIKGYLIAGGNIEEIRKASSAKYTRVFSIFTLPSIDMAISNVSRKAQNN